MKPTLYNKTCAKRISGRSDDIEAGRSAFRQDFGRLLHSPAFRRLQGKTQLFPGSETDFFRNRLTHSLEVAQVAKGIALALNQLAFFKDRPLDTDLIEFAGLAHDLGHPPFGHNGEAALDDCMCADGGFEGNAQTLRILARIEKKRIEDSFDDGFGIDARGVDRRLGLDLCMRSLAAILKYDKQIPLRRGENPDLVKGYYAEEARLVRQIKSAIVGNPNHRDFKTVECQIMDIADDIAYSTYDLEDSFKAGFLSPVELFATKPSRLESVASEINQRDGKSGGGGINARDILEVLHEILGSIQPTAKGKGSIYGAAELYNTSRTLAENGYRRTDFTSSLVKSFLDGVKFTPNDKYPMLSTVKLIDDTRLKVEVLKHFTYQTIIMSPRLRLVEYRGYDIVERIFKALSEKKGDQLFPEDYRELHSRAKTAQQKQRLVCDYVASMTDRYAVEFYSRIESVNPQSIFKPH